MRTRNQIGLAFLLCSALPLSAMANPAVGETAAAQSGVVVNAANLAQASDQELTAIAARWPDLSATERRAVLVETTRRMDTKKRQSRRSGSGRLSISVQRYGQKRDARSGGGSVVVETRVVRVRPAPGGAVVDKSLRPNEPIGFGVGFERRTQGSEVEAKTAPTPP